MKSIIGHRIDYNGVGFWKASGTYSAEIEPIASIPRDGFLFIDEREEGIMILDREVLKWVTRSNPDNLKQNRTETNLRLFISSYHVSVIVAAWVVDSFVGMSIKRPAFSQALFYSETINSRIFPCWDYIQDTLKEDFSSLLMNNMRNSAELSSWLCI